MEVNDAGAVADTFSSTTSGQVVLMDILGGMRYFAGPITRYDHLAAGIELPLKLQDAHASAHGVSLVSFQVGGLMDHWKIILGIIFITLVILSPQEGVWGYMLRYGSAIRTRLGGDDA